MENGHGDRFRYDEEGQLVEAWYNATNPANSGAGNTRYDQFNYDALGNRKGSNYVANHGWMTFTRKDNGVNQYHAWGANPATYDDEIPGWGAPGAANGVLNVDGNVAAGYNALNQAIMVNTFAMGSDWLLLGYDPLGRCVKRWTGRPDFSVAFPWVTPGSNPATYFYYEGWNLIQEGPSSGTASRNYVHGARVDEIVKQITPNNWWERYFHYDARGHCTLQTDSAGTIVEQYEYDAFGQPYFYDKWGNNVGYSAWGNRFLFTGREYLSDLKLYDYRNRLYQPELGRFMQPDPKEFAAGDYNLYRYCHNDPVNKRDPLGLYVPEVERFGDADKELIEKQIRDYKERSEAFRKEYDKWGKDTVKRSIRPASDPGNTKGKHKWNSADPQDNGFGRQKGPGGIVYYDPHNRETELGRNRDPVYGLAHELGHLSDYGKGNYPTSLMITHEEHVRGENVAIGWEREAQRAFGEKPENFRPFEE